jgi:hypothetical protein
MRDIHPDPPTFSSRTFTDARGKARTQYRLDILYDCGYRDRWAHRALTEGSQGPSGHVPFTSEGGLPVWMRAIDQDE